MFRPLAVPLPRTVRAFKKVAAVPEKKLKKGAKGNTEPNTPQAKKRPEELLNRDDWFASEEKRLKDEMAEAQQC